MGVARLVAESTWAMLCASMIAAATHVLVLEMLNSFLLQIRKYVFKIRILFELCLGQWYSILLSH